MVYMNIKQNYHAHKYDTRGSHDLQSNAVPHLYIKTVF